VIIESDYGTFSFISALKGGWFHMVGSSVITTCQVDIWSMIYSALKRRALLVSLCTLK